MSEKKIVVPEGMLNDAEAAFERSKSGAWRDQMRDVLSAALGWLSENPIVPTEEQCDELIEVIGANGRGLVRYPSRIDSSQAKIMLTEWQRGMFFAPEPEVPEEIKNLIWRDGIPHAMNGWDAIESHNNQILEAYRRGQQAGSK